MEGTSIAANIGNAVTTGVTTIVESIGSTVTSLIGNEAIVYFVGLGVGLAVIAFVVRKFLPRFRG